MLADLLQHVVEEAQAGVNVSLSRAIQVPIHQNVGLLGGSAHLRTSLSGKQELADAIPIIGDKHGLQGNGIGSQRLLGLLVVRM